MLVAKMTEVTVMMVVVAKMTEMTEMVVAVP